MSRAANAPDPQLAQAVQANCNIADAAHAGDMTLCIYLLQMREFYRWEQDFALSATMPRQDVAAWLSAREAMWDGLEDQAFAEIRVDGRVYDPFDRLGINAALNGSGLYYGAGYTSPGRATFFLADLEAVEQRELLPVYRLGREYARSLASPPATLSAHGIELRQESLRRWLWEKYEAWTLRRSPGAFKRALEHHGFAQQGEGAVDAMALAQADTLILHELAEAGVGEQLGAGWKALRSDMRDRRTDLLLRAARDLFADCQLVLPRLLQQHSEGALHFWFSNFDGWRRVLFPGLQLAYEDWSDGKGVDSLERAVATGAPHWAALCQKVLAAHAQRGIDARDEIRQVLESGVLSTA